VRVALLCPVLYTFGDGQEVEGDEREVERSEGTRTGWCESVRVLDWRGLVCYSRAKARYSIRATWARNRLARTNTSGKLVPIR